MDTSTIVGIIFLIVGALVTLSEIHTLTIYLIAIAVGLFAAGGLIIAGGGLTASLALLAVIIILGLPVAHWWRGKLKNREAEEITHNDAGHRVTVIRVADGSLRVDYRGTTWEARLDATPTAAPAAGDTFTISRREGNVLILVA